MTTIEDDFEKLTKSQKYVLSSLYKDFLEKHKENSSIDQAKYFGSIYEVQDKLFKDFSIEDLQSNLNNLHTLGFTKGSYGDNVYAEFLITDKTIVYFENKFKNNLKSVGKFINDLKDIFL